MVASRSYFVNVHALTSEALGQRYPGSGAGRSHWVKLYLDENLSPRVAEMLRAAGCDAVTAYDVGNTQLDDHAHLAYASRKGRALVTCDVADVAELATEAIRANTEHAGIMLISASFGTDEVATITQGIAAVGATRRVSAEQWCTWHALHLKDNSSCVSINEIVTAWS